MPRQGCDTQASSPSSPKVATLPVEHPTRTQHCKGETCTMLMQEMLTLVGLAFVIVGLPALILKMAAIWFVRAESDKRRLRLLGFSVGGASLAGIVTIACYVALSH